MQLVDEEVDARIGLIDCFWRAANYLTAGQIYLKSNPLLIDPLQPEHIKSRLLGHWGTSPGLNLIYAHLNRLIQDTGSQMLFVTGPGHGGPALRACAWLEGTMSEVYADLPTTFIGMEKFMREFSWPGGVPSHVSPPTPGSIHEGGELGYALVHAFGAAFDHPDLIVACVIGDGEAETGPLAASWHSNKFLNPLHDGAVLPILHLNGYKISGPTLFGRMSDDQIRLYFEGCGYVPKFVEGDNPSLVHRDLWEALDWAHQEIRIIQQDVRENGITTPPNWPLIILRTPKGWTGPKVVDGKKIEGTFRAHQVPISDVLDNPKHLRLLEEWLHSYHPEELFDADGRPSKEVLSIVPDKPLRMGASPYANGGLLLKDLNIPDFRLYALDVKRPGETIGEATRVLGRFLAEVVKRNDTNFRIVCPDETASNRLNAVFDVTDRTYLGEILGSDDHLGPDGRVMEVLSEHLCQGWLEGYLLTGRHGFFPCYEAFALIVDSMLNQHAKWLKGCKELNWRRPIASLNYLLTSHAWRQDHNGYTHQGPGFIETVMEKKADVARIYLPPDANTLLSVADHCLRSRDYINLIVAGKQKMPQWLNKAEAEKHCARGLSVWDWASSKGEPEVVIACCGDVPTLESLAATWLIKNEFSDLKIQFVNIVDLFTLTSDQVHPHGLSSAAFEELFPKELPVIFAFHGHPSVIHRVLHGRPHPERFHVRGYIEEGTTTTPFDMVVCNHMSRFHLASEVLRRLPRFQERAKPFLDHCEEHLKLHQAYIYRHGRDMDEIVQWKWT